MTVTTDLQSLRLRGRRSTGVWGAAAGAGVLATVLAYFLYAYLYLSVSSDQWPPGSLADPPLLWPGALLSVLVLSVVAVVWAARPRDDASWSGVAVALAGVAVVGAVVVGLGTVLIGDLGLRPTDDAYGAIFTTVHAVQGAATLAGIGIATLTAFEAHRLGPHPWVSAATVVTSIWWCTIVAGWIAVFGVVYLWPQLS